MSGRGFRGLNEAMRALSLASHPCRHPRPATAGLPSAASRAMATTTTPSGLTLPSAEPTTFIPLAPLSTVPVTVYNFPSLEPRALEAYSTKHLYLPLRRDILHLAVTYEGDNTRQGTANAKTRYEVHGSHRKLYRQKGTGRARAGNKQSPLRKGGGKSFGPHPRDFGTGLNRKVYDLAWRTALSYRYRRGELVVCEDGLELPLPEDFLALAQQGRLGRELEDGFVARYLGGVMAGLRWGKGHGATTFVTTDRRPNLFTSLEVAGEHGRAMEMEDVDVKNLLEGGRIVIERSALKEIIKMHRSDLVSSLVINGTGDQKGPAIGSPVID